MQICVVLFKVIGKKISEHLFQTGTSPNDVISDKLVPSRDNETDSETEIKREQDRKRGIKGAKQEHGL